MNDARKLIFIAAILIFSALCCNTASAEDTAEESFFDSLLFSARVEGIYRKNLKHPIREYSEDTGKAYLNSIFLNLEGSLGDSADFIVEFQPYVSDLYLLGGYIYIAEPLEGIGSDEDEDELDPRQVLVKELAEHSISILDRAAQNPSAERIQLDFAIGSRAGVKLGRIRNPWGFWDDYSLFRNMSAGKTDPITIGVQLRRADYGVSTYGTFSRKLNYEVAVLTGENTVDEIESDSAKDAVFKLGFDGERFDFGVNYYRRNIGNSGLVYAAGAHWRFRLNYDITLLGEYIYQHNSINDISTKSYYLQLNYNLSESVLEGLRWNTFFESYNSDLLTVDFDEELDYRYKGTIIQGSTGLLYSINHNLEIGLQLIFSWDEEGDDNQDLAFKIDFRY